MDVVLAVLLIGGVVLMAGTWVSFFRGDFRVNDDECWKAFESAFPVADGWLAVCMLIAAAGLLLGETFGLAFALMAGSAGIFLGLMDVTWNVQHGQYQLVRTSSSMRFEALLNVLTFAIATVVIIYALERLL